MAADKLSIIQSACALTGNLVPNVADDGSDEWNVASAAYEAAVDTLIEAHNWNFATVVTTLVRAGASPDDQFTDAYNRPPGSLALVWVRVFDIPMDYKVIGGQICVNSRGQAVTCKYVQQPDPGSWPPMFVDCVRISVMAGLYRGLNEDMSAAQSMEQQATQRLQDARSRTDQEQGKRALFNSRLRAARRVRRPWNSTPPDYGGTGNPS